jgi:prophage regulatory protein
MQTLPSTGYLRLKQILGSKKANPHIPPIIPIGKTSWWQGIKEGRFPKPIKLSPRITVWRVEDILALCENINREIGGNKK